MKPELFHYFRWGAVGLDQLDHVVHGAVDMFEKSKVALAQHI